MSGSVEMPGSVGLAPISPAVLQESLDSISEERLCKFRPTSVRVVLVIIILLFSIFACNIVFLIYLNSRLDVELDNYNKRLSESMDKVAEFENQVQQLSKQIENYARKNSSNPLPLVGETYIYQRASVAKVEEYPDIREVDEQGLVPLHNSSSETNSTPRRGAPPPLLSSGNDRSSSEESEDEEDEDEEIQTFSGGVLSRAPPNRRRRSTELPDNKRLSESMDKTAQFENEADKDEEIETSKGVLLLSNRRTRRSAELPDGSGVGNLIDVMPEHYDRRNKSGKPDLGKLSSSQNLTRTQCNCTPSEDLENTQIPQKTANRRLTPIKKTPSTHANSAREVVEESMDTAETQRTVIAAHFGADSSKYSKHTHSYYDGNYHLRHPTGEYEDWKPSSWFDELSMNKHFSLVNGNIEVHSHGLYFVYTQIFYSELSDVNGYTVYLNSQVVLQCITSTYSTKNQTLKSNTCYTGGVIRCQSGDKISVKAFDRNRRVILEATRSFVGMFKIGEF